MGVEKQFRNYAAWPKSSYGNMSLPGIERHLKSRDLDPAKVLDTPSRMFGGGNAWDFVCWMVDNKKAESYEDAMHEVAGIIRRNY